MKCINGNALFLILIAVALFGLLSFAITQSSRNGGNASREQAIIDAAQLVQAIGQIQSAYMRLGLQGEDLSNDNLVFGGTAFSLLSPCTTGTNCLWSTEGGGINYNSVLFDFMLGTTLSLMNTNYNIEIDGVGNVGEHEGFLQWWLGTDAQAEAICREFNNSLGLGTTIPSDGWSDGVLTAFPGEETACFMDTGNGNVYMAFYVFAKDIS